MGKLADWEAILTVSAMLAGYCIPREHVFHWHDLADRKFLEGSPGQRAAVREKTFWVCFVFGAWSTP